MTKIIRRNVRITLSSVFALSLCHAFAVGGPPNRGISGGSVISRSSTLPEPSTSVIFSTNRSSLQKRSTRSYGSSTDLTSSTADVDKESDNKTSTNSLETRGGDTTSTHARTSTWPCLDELDRRVIKLALPTIANFAINPIVGAVDLFWVGKMGNALAVAGQSAANQMFNSCFFLLSYLPSVTATLVSKEHAKESEEGVQDAVCQALFVGSIIALIGTGMIYLLPDVLRLVIPPGSAAHAFAKPYLLIRALSFLPSLITVIGYSAFRGTLDTVTPLKIALCANLLNAILDPILIFRFNMGVQGAAIATVIAEVLSAGSFLALLLKSKMIRWSKIFRLPSWSKLQPLLRGGAALQLRNLAMNFTFLAVARATQSIDSTGVAAAAHSIAIQVFQVGGIVLLALSTVAQTLIPNEMIVKTDPVTGLVSGGIESARGTVRRLMSWGFLLGTFLGGLQIALLPVIHRFSPLVEVQKAALMPSYIASVLQIINGMVFIGEGVMVGTGSFLQLGIYTSVATVGITMALAVLPARFGLTGVWLSFGVFNVLRLLGVVLHQTKLGPLSKRMILKKQEAQITPS
eukprot:CAMPEP_0194373692 /NCGR_PEP_ID=MMETSP0174-20130528/22171_1 /TAXON_ID=216777 /ORGANISM="Proboscia alata, Strain PI-D3" /LENGTH=573 /DNA_ID=CAMNT_0039152939 /DNA_START=89 /DNA_END=1810 /DNA_ORIENTATION=-